MQHMLVTLVTLVHHLLLLSLQWLRLSDTDDHSDAQVTLLMLSKHPQLKKTLLCGKLQKFGEFQHRVGQVFIGSSYTLVSWAQQHRSGCGRAKSPRLRQKKESPQ